MRKQLFVAALAALITASASAKSKGLFIDSKEVKKSAYYTGTAGQASIEPVSSRDWILRYDGEMEDLAIRNYGFLIENQVLNDYLYGIANRILAQWPGKAPATAIFVQGDGSPLLYGGATTFSKEVFLRYGILLHAESEDEVAAVVAHELAHVLLEHGDALATKKSMQNMLKMAEDTSSLYAAAEALRVDSETREVSIDPSIEKNLKRTAEQKAVADQLYTSVHATLYSRNQEMAADKLALDLMIAAGYSPRALRDSLERMAASHDLSTEVSNFFEESSKKFLQDSMNAVQRYTDENGIQSDQLQDFMKFSNAELKDSVIDFGKDALVKFSAKSHPVPAKRVDKLTAYLYDEYPRKVRRQKPDSAAAATFRQGTIGNLIADYSEANQAIELIGYGDLEGAAGSVKNSLTVATNAEAYPAFAAFSLGRARDDVAGALKPVKSVAPDALIPLFAGVEIADVLAQSGETTRLENLVALHESLYGHIDDYYPAKISVAKAADDTARVEQLAMECYGAAGFNSPLGERCLSVSGVNLPEPAAGTEGDNNPMKAIGNVGNSLGNMFNKK